MIAKSSKRNYFAIDHCVVGEISQSLYDVQELPVERLAPFRMGSTVVTILSHCPDN